jgi:hypothetical protein
MNPKGVCLRARSLILRARLKENDKDLIEERLAKLGRQDWCDGETIPCPRANWYKLAILIMRRCKDWLWTRAVATP